MKIDWRIILIFLLLLTWFPSGDLSHHIRTSYLYNKMIRTGEVIEYDSQLAFKESTFTYGAPAYILTGLLWFLLGKASVDLTTCLCLVITGFVISELFKDNLHKISALIISSTNIFFDSYIAVFVTTFFWMSILLHERGSKYYFIPLLISGFSHPFTLVYSLYFVFKDKRNLLWWIPAMIYFSIMTLLFGAETQLSLFNLLRVSFPFFIRLLISFSPLLKKEWLKKVAMVLITLILIGGLMELKPSLQAFNIIYFHSFPDFPNIPGYLRVIDSQVFPFLSHLHEVNATLYRGSFMENHPVLTGVKQDWGEEEYFNYLTENNISHVLVLKGTSLSLMTNEMDYLNESMKVWNDTYYNLYEVGS